MFSLSKLLNRLTEAEERVFIQTHNFPDPDAVASAYGLQQLLKLKNLNSFIIYDGMIERTALLKMIEDLEIDIQPMTNYDLAEKDLILIVDGCKRNTNVTDLAGEEIAVIDHHPVQTPDDVDFVDIRPDAGSCSSIITSYYRELKLPIPTSAATAMMTGLLRDTDSMTRSVSSLDVEAYGELFMSADYDKVSSLVLNNISLQDLIYYDYLIRNMKREGDLGFCVIKEGCNQNLLGILGDFLLSLEEIKFTALFAMNSHGINISFRNEKPETNAADVMKEIVNAIGTGGGHRHMAGGVLYDKRDFDENWMFRKLSLLING